MTAASVESYDVEAARRRFSSLGRGFAFLDAPGGSQVPDEVGDAIAAALRDACGNIGAPYETSRRVDEIFEGARADSAHFLGCDSAEIVFGPNMTTINFNLTRAFGRELAAGDEIVVTRLDHDGSVAPWLELADDLGLVVHHADVRRDCSLDLDHLASLLNERTRVVAFSWAANAVGTVSDAARIAERAHGVGALVWIDAVHYAAHAPVDVRAIGADVLLCSPYKFCGPHLGIAAVRRELLERWRPYRVRPPASPAGRRYEPGSQPYELLAGLRATYAYLDSLGGLATLAAYEQGLGVRFLEQAEGLLELYGLPTMEGRVTTFLCNVPGVAAERVAVELGQRGFGVWAHDTYYSLGLYERLGYDQAVRIGLFHYNTLDEVERLFDELRRLTS